MSPFIAVDWGTTNRRVYRIGADGQVQARAADGQGVLAMAGAGYPEAVAAIRAEHGGLPLVCAGMVGSNIGWQVVPYVPAPADLSGIAGGCAQPAADVFVVPGVAEAADVMRGEEVQLVGAVAAGLAPADALLCQPGTHCKWARMQGGAIAGFTTALTGELFALLKGGGVLARQLSGTASVGAAFAAGVAEAGRRDLLASLFGIRARGVLGHLADADAASYASGLLIGSDVAARLDAAGTDAVYLLADDTLGALYAAAIEHHGARTVRVNSEAAFLAGITAIWKELA